MLESSHCPLAGAALPKTAAVEAAEQTGIIFFSYQWCHYLSICRAALFLMEDLPPHPSKGMKLHLSFESPFLASSLVVRKSLPKIDPVPPL